LAKQVFLRQAIPMTWDFAETNPFGNSGGSIQNNIEWLSKSLSFLQSNNAGEIYNKDATRDPLPKEVVISTDPPYFDNVGYSDLSDFFYVWLRRSLSNTWPELFRRLVTPKKEELIVAPHRHASKEEAENFFMTGMRRALGSMQQASTRETPLAIYYAFKQAEASEHGVSSAGWSTFLQAVIEAGLIIDRTWPIRMELTSNLKAKVNALASAVVLVCRNRPEDAPAITSADFVRALKREMPDAIAAIRRAGVGPVDMQQSVIGPGMEVFSRHSKVLEDDDSAMTVKTALALINRVWEEIENELDAAFDRETQVALAWYGSYGFDARASGELITLTTAKNTSDRALFASGVFRDLKGKAALTAREELPPGWTPATDKTLTVWECVQHTARVLRATDGGGEAAARLVAQMGPKSEDARKLAYRLFEIATRKGWSAEALVYNELAEEWPRLEEVAASAAEPTRAGTVQGALNLEPTP
jgi:putative DNA methylase